MYGEDTRYVESSDREAWWRLKYKIAVERFKSGMESEEVFRAVLFTLGYRGQEISTEVSLATMGGKDAFL
jgi:hypothetical protein